MSENSRIKPEGHSSLRCVLTMCSRSSLDLKHVTLLSLNFSGLQYPKLHRIPPVPKSLVAAAAEAAQRLASRLQTHSAPVKPEHPAGACIMSALLTLAKQTSHVLTSRTHAKKC